MKYNLKNFPQTSPEKEKDPEFWSELASDRLHWKQGFEKELRELKEEKEAWASRLDEVILIEEILGDSV